MVKSGGEHESRAGQAPRLEPDIPHIEVDDLMRGAREVVLEFQRQKYRLRITSKGKLILTK